MEAKNVRCNIVTCSDVNRCISTSRPGCSRFRPEAEFGGKLLRKAHWACCGLLHFRYSEHTAEFSFARSQTAPEGLVINGQGDLHCDVGVF